MKYLAALLLMLYSTASIPDAGNFSSEWWQYWMLGRPCSTATDRTEGTCDLEVKRKPTWQ